MLQAPRCIRGLSALIIICGNALLGHAWSDAADQTVLSEQPELIRSASYTYPVRLLKKGVQGTVLLDIYINEQGAVDEVEIAGKSHPVLDSIARRAAFQFIFSPAKEQGEPVPVVIRFQYVFDLAQILRDIRYTPNFSGRVIDAETEMPFRNFPVVCDFFDTTSDTALSMPFGDYIRLISSVKGQEYNDGKLVTRTDSLGYFQFCFLPVCSLKVRIQPPFHKVFISKEAITPGTNARSVYPLSALTGLNQESEYEIVVYGKQSTHERINVQEAEFQYGLTDDISRIIYVKSSVNQFPERGSAILIHGGGIYDNSYIVGRVPMLPPSHFTNYPTLDISGILIATVEDVSIITSRIGGRYSNAAGCIVSMKPGIYRPADARLIKHRELVANVSTRKIDLSLSTPLRKGKDLYQISYTLASQGFLWMWDASYRISDFGLAPPEYYGDLNITGTSKFKNFDMHSFAWLAWDAYQYSPYYKEGYIFPWGAGSVAFESTNRKAVHRVAAGGSSQHYYEGKRIGTYSPLKAVHRENATIVLESESIPLGPFTLDCTERMEYIRWYGSIDKRSFLGSTPDIIVRSGSEVHLQGHLGITHKNDFISFGSDVLVGSVTRYKNFFVDPGLWCSIPHKGGSIDFDLGIVSSLPDIRGMPDERYRGEINKTYMATSRLEHVFFRQTTKISLEPYIRWRDQCPSFSYEYLYPIWVDTLATPLYAGGINCRVSVVREKRCDINIAGTVGKSYRIEHDTRMPYEWDIPWSVKSFFNFHFFNNQFHASFNSILSAGIPYRDVNDNNTLKRPAIYLRPDIQCEYRARNLQHRYFTRYDLYLGCQNLIGHRNNIEPYWQDDMSMRWVQLTPRMIYLGGRFAFRM